MPFCRELNSKVGCTRISPPNENDEVYKCRTKNKNVIASQDKIVNNLKKLTSVFGRTAYEFYDKKNLFTYLIKYNQ